MNKYWKHKAKIIFGLGVPLGLLVLLIQELFHIPKDVMMHWYFIGSFFIIFSAVLINCIWQFRFQRKLKKMQVMLYQEKELDQYIIQTDALLKKVKSNFNRNQLIINLSVAYFEKQQYEKAIEILRTIDEKTLSGICKVVYYHDLAYYCFMLDESEQALQIMNVHRKEFTKWERHDYLGPRILINYVYMNMHQKKWEEAKRLLLKLEEMNRDTMLERSFQLVKNQFDHLTENE